MLQCAYCGHRTFETDITLSARVRLTGTEDGDYQEEEIDRYNCDWHILECCQCGEPCDEALAREAFDAATGDGLDDDIYAWYEAQTATAPQETHPAQESTMAIAQAWQFWRWQQEHGYGSGSFEPPEGKE
jgi:hypothetical protein